MTRIIFRLSSKASQAIQNPHKIGYDRKSPFFRNHKQRR
jgi:hypothetical protein